MVNVTWKKFNQTRSLPKTKVGYNTTIVHGTWKKTKLALDPHRKKICFRFRLQYCFDSWDFRKSISLDHHRKKSTFISDYSTTVVHSTYTTFNPHLTSPKKIVSSYSTRRARNQEKNFIGTLPPPKKIVCNYSITMVHETQKLLFGIMIMLNDKRVDPIQKAFG